MATARESAPYIAILCFPTWGAEFSGRRISQGCLVANSNGCVAAVLYDEAYSTMRALELPDVFAETGGELLDAADAEAASSASRRRNLRPRAQACWRERSRSQSLSCPGGELAAGARHAELARGAEKAASVVAARREHARLTSRKSRKAIFPDLKVLAAERRGWTTTGVDVLVRLRTEELSDGRDWRRCGGPFRRGARRRRHAGQGSGRFKRRGWTSLCSAADRGIEGRSSLWQGPAPDGDGCGGRHATVRHPTWTTAISAREAAQHHGLPDGVVGCVVGAVLNEVILSHRVAAAVLGAAWAALAAGV